MRAQDGDAGRKCVNGCKADSARGITAKEISAGTGMSLSSAYRALCELEAQGLIRRVVPFNSTDGWGANAR